MMRRRHYWRRRRACLSSTRDGYLYSKSDVARRRVDGVGDLGHKKSQSVALAVSSMLVIVESFTWYSGDPVPRTTSADGGQREGDCRTRVECVPADDDG